MRPLKSVIGRLCVLAHYVGIKCSSSLFALTFKRSSRIHNQALQSYRHLDRNSLKILYIVRLRFGLYAILSRIIYASHYLCNQVQDYCLNVPTAAQTHRFAIQQLYTMNSLFHSLITNITLIGHCYYCLITTQQVYQ